MEEETSDTQKTGEPEGADESRDASEEPAPDVLERLVSWVSLLLLLSAAGFLVWEGTRREAPPAFQTQIQKIWSSDGRHYVRIGIRNTGDESVQTLGVQVALLDGNRTVAASDAQLSWLPSHSERQAVVIFNKDPRLFELRVQLKGYEEP